MNLINKDVILHFTTQMAWGGGEQQLIYTVLGLNQRGIPQIILCPTDSKLAALSQQHHLKFLVFNKKWRINLRRIIRDNNITLIHCHDAESYQLAILASILLRLKLPVIVSKKNFAAKQQSWLQALKYRLPQLKKIICVSHAVAQNYVQFLDKDKIEVVYDAVDIERFQNAVAYNLKQQLNIPPQALVIGIIASLIWIKDHDTFLKAIAHLITASYPVYGIIVGEGPLMSHLVDYCQQLNISKYIRFPGFRNDIAEVLKGLDVLMITSHREGLCSTLLQAMCAEVPIIASNVGGIPEIIAHNETGLLAKAGDPTHFASLAANLYDDHHLRQRLSANARIKVVQYGLDIFIEKMVGIYEEALTPTLIFA